MAHHSKGLGLALLGLWFRGRLLDRNSGHLLREQFSFEVNQDLQGFGGQANVWYPCAIMNVFVLFGMIFFYCAVLFIYGLVKEVCHERCFPWITIRLFLVPAAVFLIFASLALGLWR